MRLITEAGRRARLVSVTGAIDEASIEVIQMAVREAMDNSISVELDLRDVYPREAGWSALLAWAQARARERNVKLVIRAARPSARHAGRCEGARGPRTPGQRAAGCRDELRPKAPGR